MKPFLKWAGGKTQLLPEIEKRMPEVYNDYYEPFVGAGSVFLNFAPQRAYLNDLNSELINTYQTVKNELPSLLEKLESLQEKVNETSFYEIRALDREENFLLMSNVDRAARTIYLNKTCFNGMYRVNPKGFFNVPFNKNLKSKIYSTEALTEISDYLNNNEVFFLNEDYTVLLKKPKAGDFIYLDPPYDYENDDGFTGYTKEGFSRENQKEIFKELQRLDSLGAKWLYSNNSTTFINDLFKDYRIEEVQARRSINSKASKRGKVPEVLISNF